MSDDGATGGVEIRSLSIERGDDREYERVREATATLVGDGGPVRLERRYEALPRHNDVVVPELVETNDDMLASADAVHVYTQFYADETYLRDDHERWEPTDPSVLADADAFTAACRAHLERTAPAAYAAAVED